MAPVHCTGEPAFAALKSSFGKRYLYAGLGTTLILGKKVETMAESGQPQMQAAMDEADLRQYRELMINGHDNPERLLAHLENNSHGR